MMRLHQGLKTRLFPVGHGTHINFFKMQELPQFGIIEAYLYRVLRRKFRVLCKYLLLLG